VEPKDHVRQYAVSPESVDWDKLERQFGVKRETLEKNGGLDKLLNWQKTDLLPIAVTFGDSGFQTDARLSLRSLPEGGVTFAVHAIRKQPELERPYFGVRFTDEDKNNLRTSGNLGRVIEAEFVRGEKTPVYLSIDRQTNELVSVRVDRVKIPETVKGVALSNGQRNDLAAGKAVRLEDMTSAKGTKFSADIQFNADKRGLEFIFDNANRKEQSRKQGNTTEPPASFRGVSLDDKQRGSLSEGKTVYVSGLTDRKGKAYSGYVTLDRQTDKLNFMFPQAYKEALAAGKVIPDDRHATQTAVNSEGKTNEATKSVKEPLKQGQASPDESNAKARKQQQSEKGDVSEKPQKTKGRRM
jgi:hypothetical protein